ncbi:unnamed protein product [Rhizophagus irregularis]|nr:unnamed protein product [Rhizophagus irregularis]
MWVVWVGSAGVWSVGVWVGSAGGCGSVGWECGSADWECGSVGVGVDLLLGPFSFRLSLGECGVWECGLGVRVGVGVWVGSVGVFSLLDLLLGPFSFRLSLGLPSLCLGLLFIRSPFSPFSFRLSLGMWVVWVGSAGVWSVGVWVGSAGGCGSVGWECGSAGWECGSVGWECGSLPSLCLGLLFIRSPFSPFSFRLSLGMWVVWVGSAGVWSVGVWVGSAGGCGSVGWECGSAGWECGSVGVWVGSVGVGVGLLFIRSPFRPFFFSSLFRFIFSPSRSSLSFFTSSFHTNSVLPGTLYHRSTR